MCLSPDLSAFMAGSRCIFIYSISETFVTGSAKTDHLVKYVH